MPIRRANARVLDPGKFAIRRSLTLSKPGIPSPRPWCALHRLQEKVLHSATKVVRLVAEALQDRVCGDRCNRLPRLEPIAYRRRWEAVFRGHRSVFADAFGQANLNIHGSISEGREAMRSKGPINNYIGHRLRELRLEKRLTSQEVARRAGMAPGSYSCLENGWYKINLDNLYRILWVLGAAVTDVWPPHSPEQTPGEVVDEGYLTQVAQISMALQPSPLTVDDVLDAVSLAFGLDKSHLTSTSRGWERLGQARGACAYLVKEYPDLTISELSRTMGLTISAISHLAKRFGDKANSDDKLEERVSEARRILSKLHRKSERHASAGGVR